MSRISTYSSYKNNTVQSDYMAIIDDGIFIKTNSIYCIFYSENPNNKLMLTLLGFDHIEGDNFKIDADNFTPKLYKRLVNVANKYDFNITF